MCNMIQEKASIKGAGKGNNGWFQLKEVNVYYDHPDHADMDHGINIDFLNESLGIDKRVAVELSPDSAIELMKAIKNAISKGVNIN